MSAIDIRIGDCRDVLRTMPDESVHCVVTSPPYWGLRDYKIPSSIWGGDAECEHEFACEAIQTEVGRGNWAQGVNGRGEEQPGGADAKREPIRSKAERGFCTRCGAWRGALGLEPDYRLYVEHIVEVFREVRRVLRKDGTLWLNLGDCYATGAGKVGDHPGGGAQGERWSGGPPSDKSTLRGNGHVGGGPKLKSLAPVPGFRGAHTAENSGKHAYRMPRERPALGRTSQIADRKIAGIGPMTQPNRMPQPRLKPKDLVGIPWRVALALQDDGWWLRRDIIWAKPNPMPESTRDRCTTAHEYLFHLSKSERYFYDADAIKEPASLDTHERRSVKMPDGWDSGPGTHGSYHRNGREKGKTRKLAEPGSGTKNNESFDRAMAVMPDVRNKRSVWTVATQPFREAHFATFPPALQAQVIELPNPPTAPAEKVTADSGSDRGKKRRCRRCSHGSRHPSS